MKRIPLDGIWSLSPIIHEKNSPLEKESYDMQIPGELHDALYKSSVIPDPYSGLESVKSSFIGRTGWKLSKKVALAKAKGAEYCLVISLPFSDYSVFINDSPLGDYHLAREQRIDCTGHIRNAENEITIIFTPGQNGEKINAMGIKGGIYLEEDKDLIISSVSPHPERTDGKWNVAVDIDATVFNDTAVPVAISINGRDSEESIFFSKDIKRYTIECNPGDVQLWYPNGYGQPHLYPITITIGEERFEKDIGFRTISADNALVVNGLKLFLRGALYIKEDLIPTRTDQSRIERLMRSAAAANMNIIRIDGWIPSPELYEAADRHGILIYQTGWKSNDVETALISHPSVIPDTKEMVSVLTRMKSIGFPSYPSLQTIERIDDKEKNITSPAMDFHGEGIERILSMIASQYLFPSSIDKLIYLSELQQALSLEREAALIERDGKATGILIETLNDSWPAVSSSCIEHGGKWKLSMYAARAFFSQLAPVIIIDDGYASIYLANRSARNVKAELSVKLRSFSGSKRDAREYVLDSPPGSFIKAASFPLQRLKKDEGFLYVKMSTKGIVRERVILLDKPKNLQLENPMISSELTKADSKTIYIKLRSEKPALHVALVASGIRGIFSDNLISIRPSAEKTIIFSAEDDIDETEFRSKLRIYDLWNAMH